MGRATCSVGDVVQTLMPQQKTPERGFFCGESLAKLHILGNLAYITAYCFPKASEPDASYLRKWPRLDPNPTPLSV